MRKFKVKNLELTTNEIETFIPKNVFVPNVVFDVSFNILVKSGDYVKKGQIILEKNGQKLASPVSGLVREIKLGSEINNELVYYINIENDEKYLSEIVKPKKIETKQDLLEFCKEYCLVFKHNFAEKFFKDLDSNLVLDLFDENFVFNNFLVLKSNQKIVLDMVKYLTKILNINRIKIFVNKQNKNFVKSVFLNENILEYFNTQNIKIVIKTKQTNIGITAFDLYNFSKALNGEKQTENIISFVGGACKKNCVIKTVLGVRICDLIDHFKGLKQNIEEIEDFKYMSLVAYNDEIQLNKKIKQAKNQEDKEKLIKMLNEKKHQAYDNIFSKISLYHEKFLDCLSCCLLNGKHSKSFTKNLELPLGFEVFGVHLFSFREFR